MRLHHASLCLLLSLASPLGLMGQNPGRIEFPAPSPFSVLRQRIGLTDFELTYSRPSLKGRQVFGALEPYGVVWRTGANAATTLRFSTPIRFGGKEVPAGVYALFTIPEKETWTVILNAQHDQWGAYRYDPTKDVVRVEVKVETLERSVETLRFNFDDLRDESAVLSLEWEAVRLPIALQVDVESTLVPQIEAAMASAEKKPAGVFFNSALFYFEHGKDLSKALAWVNESIVLNPQAFYAVHLKAKILAKLGRKEEAVVAARQSIELAKAAHDVSYLKLNRDLIDSLERGE